MTGQVPPEQLLVSQKLSRELKEYSSPSPAARAVWQMQAEGKTVRPGQRVRFLYTLGKPGVAAWDVPVPPDPRSIDLRRYLALRHPAVQTVLDPVAQSLPGGLPTPADLFPACEYSKHAEHLGTRKKENDSVNLGDHLRVPLC